MILTPNHVDELERAFHDCDNQWCHLLWVPWAFETGDGLGMKFKTACGSGVQELHRSHEWNGEKTCYVCGRPICPDCLAVEE